MNIAQNDKTKPMNLINLFKPLSLPVRVSGGLLVLRLVAGWRIDKRPISATDDQDDRNR